MRYKCPEGCAGVTLAGVPLVIGKDGTVTADAAVAGVLAAHGILPASSATSMPKPGDAPR